MKRVVGGADEPVERTTPEAIDLQATFRRMADAGDRACAMEVSSHALALHRADGVRFAVAAFTNLTQDHLDFHGDMEAYFARQAQPVRGRARRPRGRSTSTTRTATSSRPSSRRRRSRPPATSAPTCAPSTCASTPPASRFRCIGADGEVDVALPLPGRFNVENALCALAVAMALGVGLARRRGGARATPSGSRAASSPSTRASRSRSSSTTRTRPTRSRTCSSPPARSPPPEARLICVFGCGGDRDRDKRPLMGEIAARLADLAVVTSDNPRSEDPEAIIDEIRAGIDRGRSGPRSRSSPTAAPRSRSRSPRPRPATRS